MNNSDNKLAANTIILRNGNLATADLGGEIGMLDIRNGKYYGFDPIASRIWEIIERPEEISGIVNMLLEEYEVDRDTCTADVMEFLNRVYKDGLIKIKEEE